MTTKQWANFITLTLIWGASFLWIKIAVQEVGPFTIVTIRLAMALLVLLGFFVAQRPGFPRTRRQWGVIAIQGLTSTAVPWILIIWAEKHIDSALATVLNATVPLFTIVCAHIFISDDRMTRRRVAGLLVGFSGIVLLVQDDLRFFALGGEEAKWQLLGQGAMLLAACFYGVSNVYARAKLKNVSPLYQAFYTMLVADALMWIITPAVDVPFRLPAEPITWIAITWLGVLGAGLSYLMFYNLLHQIGPTRVATVTYTIPVVGVTLGVVFLDEALTWSLVLGTVLIVSGVRWVNQR